MNYKTDIKVTFLDSSDCNNLEKIRLFFKDIFGNDIQIDLRKGEIVYSQTICNSNSLRIYLKKGFINIQEEDKPDYLDYYIGYKKEEISDNLMLHNFQKSFNNLDLPVEETLEDASEDVSEALEGVLEEILKGCELPVEEIQKDFFEINISATEGVLENEIIAEDMTTSIDKEIADTIKDTSLLELQKLSGLNKKSQTKSTKSKRGPGRPKKRGPKKGSKRKIVEK